jgi:hypothetical protein
LTTEEETEADELRQEKLAKDDERIERERKGRGDHRDGEV